MAVNVKATYKNIPQETIGPFIATLEYYESSGITYNSGSLTGLTVANVGTPCTGSIETLNIGPSYKILKSDLTHQQLINGYTFPQIKCGDTYIIFQSTDVCYSSYQADLVGSNGLPTVRLTVYNDASDSISSTLTVVPLNGAASPIPSTITVTSLPSETNYAEIGLGKGKYSFNYNISQNTPSTDPLTTVELSFIECGAL